MALASQDFSMPAGDSKILKVTVVDDDGSIVPLNNITHIRWKLAKSVAREAIVAKSLSDGVQILTPASDGRFDVTLNSADTENIRQGDYYHEAEVIDVDGLVTTVLSGTVTILPTLIKPEVSPQD